MHALPFVLAFASAVVLAPALLRCSRAPATPRPTIVQRTLPFPFGVLSLAAALLALVPLMLLQVLGSAEVFHPEIFPIAGYALGVLALGLVDDTLGERSTAERRTVGRAARLARTRRARCCAASSRPACSRRSDRSGWRCWR